MLPSPVFGSSLFARGLLSSTARFPTCRTGRPPFNTSGVAGGRFFLYVVDRPASLVARAEGLLTVTHGLVFN